jgi:hypothetical protein
LGKIDRGYELDFIYSRYAQADKILDMPVAEADKVIEAGKKALWEERCWQKWLSEDSRQSYNDYRNAFFGERKAPDLNKALALAEEIKRREEAKK